MQRCEPDDAAIGARGTGDVAASRCAAMRAKREPPVKGECPHAERRADNEKGRPKAAFDLIGSSREASADQKK